MPLLAVLQPEPMHGEAHTTMHLAQTDGRVYDGAVTDVADHESYTFTATAGHTYQIETLPGSLYDTIIDLLDTDEATVLVQNDDDERTENAGSYASFIEWTAPESGDYYVLVRGYGDEDIGSFQVSITDQVASDPCAGGSSVSGGQGTIEFEPESGQYEHDAICQWTISCATGMVPSIDFEEFEIEDDYDFVTLYNGAVVDPATVLPGGALTGLLLDMRTTLFEGTTSDMLMVFTSDESVAARGFEAAYTCTTASAPAPPPAGTVVDVIVGSADHTTLLAAVGAANLQGTLASPGPFTVFAPTDAAFAALPAGTVAALLADIPTLTAILTYHVVGAEVYSSALSNGQVVTTLNGASVTVSITSAGVFINNARVTVADIAASNGVVHVIDAVLMPPAAPAPPV